MLVSQMKGDLRTPSPILWTTTSLILIYMVWCIVVPTLTATNHLYSIQSVECTDDTEFEARRTYEQRIVCLWSSLNLGLCIILLLDVWTKNEYRHIHVIVGVVGVAIAMIYTFDAMQKNEMQGMENLKNRYLGLLPLTHKNTHNTSENCDMLTNVHHWQTEFKCCGLESYQDWNSVIPDSCSCEGEDDKSGCVGAGDILVYEKPCLPIVVSLAAKQRSTFQIIITIWVVITGAPLGIFMLCIVICIVLSIFILALMSNCCCDLKLWMDKIFGRKSVPVVFIRKNNNNQIVVENMEEQHNVTDDNVDISHCPINDSPVRMIPQSLLRRFQEELDPPPVEHKVRNSPCLCIIPPPPRIRSFYTILVDDDSPLLPSNAVLVDAHKPTTYCFWEEGHREYDVRTIVWPHVKTQDTTDM